MSDLRSADRLARRAAQTIFDRPVMLEAGAGTGKTTTLVARVLAWSLGQGWDRAAEQHPTSEPHVIAAEVLQGVVAITFTEAAAAEMETRIAESFAMVVDERESEIRGFDPDCVDSEAPERRARAAMLLETFDHLSVSTIHAFCFGLLTDHPLQANLHPDLRVDADGSQLQTHARLVVERWTQKAYRGNADSPFLKLATRGIGPARLLEALTQWLAMGIPAATLTLDPFSPPRVTAYLSALEKQIRTLRDLIADQLEGLAARLLAPQVVLALDQSRDAFAALPPDPGRLVGLAERLAEVWPHNLISRLGNWSRAKWTGEEEDRLAPVGTPLRAAAGELRDSIRFTLRLDPDLLTAARTAMGGMVEEIEEDLRRRGIITFAGLLRETQALLRDSPAVLDRLRQRLQLLLVDEFQDTDPVQSEIVRRLSLEGDPTSCPSLFVVGDPKQSIYGWRDADLGAYEAFQAALERRGGERFHLTINFRSAQEILDEVERVISPVMRPRPGIQPPFQSLEAARLAKGAKPFRSDSWREIEYWVSWRPDPSGAGLSPGTHAETQRVEARAVAEDIHQLHSQAGVPWSDIGILFRKTLAQPTFLEELRRRGVPFAVNRDRNYYRRREVIEVAAWIRAIINPADHLALLTVLRSVTVGVPDAALIPLWGQSFPKLVTELGTPDAKQLEKLDRIITAIARSLPPEIPGLDRIAGWDRALTAALASLARLRDSYRRDPADVFVGNIRRELLIEAFEAARFQGRFRLANLNRFFRQLETALESEDSDVHAILRELRLGVLEARDAEEAMPRDAVEDAVQVMTIHTAKGLEFRHIYLVQMHSGTRSGGNDLLEAREVTPGDWEYQLFGAPTLSYQRAEAKIRSIETAEAVRTLYVALTRACQRLVLIGSWPASPAPVPEAEASNYVDLLQNREGLPNSIATLANDPATQLLGYHDQGEIRWRFLGSSQSLGSSRRKEVPAAWLLDASAMRQQAKRRQDHIRDAAERMQHKLTQAATAGVSERLEAVAAAIVGDDETGGGKTGDDSRQTALSVGTALHRALETWNFDRTAPEELERQQDRLATHFSGLLETEALEEARDRLASLAEGALIRRLAELKSHVLGREIPLLLASPGTQEDPITAVTGAIDLLYRDPASGDLVVADFKSDRIDQSEELSLRAQAYGTQEDRYARAVQRTLGLDRPPRIELWWLWLDTVTDQRGKVLQ